MSGYAATGQVTTAAAPESAPAVQTAAASTADTQAAATAVPFVSTRATHALRPDGFPDPSSITSVDALLDLGESVAEQVRRLVPHIAPPEGGRS
jgi:hypothetical protein